MVASWVGALWGIVVTVVVAAMFVGRLINRIDEMQKRISRIDTRLTLLERAIIEKLRLPKDYLYGDKP